MHALVAKIEPDKVLRWCRDGDFLRYFCILHFQGAACSTDLHSKFALRAVRLGEEKHVKQKYLLHMFLQYGELRPTSG